MDQGSMEFRGTRHGVLLRAHIGPDVQRFVDVLRQRLQKSKGFLSDSYVSARFEDDEVSVEAMHLIEAVLAESGLELRSVATGSRTVGLPTQAAVTQSGSSIAYTENEASVLIKRTLRSGQRVDFDGDVVVMGDVNPGAEVVAGGDIVVMGSLRGLAHAGAYGNADAVVVAFRLRPTQLRISDRISRSPDAEGTDPAFPELARISKGAIVIEAFSVPAGNR
jgi:septum site-determining protein MinC